MKAAGILLFLVMTAFLSILIALIFIYKEDDTPIVFKTPSVSISECFYTKFTSMMKQKIKHCLYMSGNKDLSVIAMSNKENIVTYHYSVIKNSYILDEELSYKPKIFPVPIAINDTFFAHVIDVSKIKIFSKKDEKYFDGNTTEIKLPVDIHKIFFEESTENSLIVLGSDLDVYQLIFNGEHWIINYDIADDTDTYKDQYKYTNVVAQKNDKLYRLLISKTAAGFAVVEYSKNNDGLYLSTHSIILSSLHELNDDYIHSLDLNISSDMRTLIISDPFYTPFHENDTHKGRIISYNRTTITTPFYETTHTNDPNNDNMSHFGLKTSIVDSDHVFVSGGNMSENRSPTIYIYKISTDGSLIYEENLFLNDVDNFALISDILVSHHNTLDKTVRVMWSHSSDTETYPNVLYYIDSDCI